MRFSNYELCRRCRKGYKINGEKYCLGCRKKLIKEMEECGYLTILPKKQLRSIEKWEVQHETRRGTQDE